jgi:hypothetical protein
MHECTLQERERDSRFPVAYVWQLNNWTDSVKKKSPSVGNFEITSFLPLYTHFKVSTVPENIAGSHFAIQLQFVSMIF